MQEEAEAKYEAAVKMADAERGKIRTELDAVRQQLNMLRWGIVFVHFGSTVDSVFFLFFCSPTNQSGQNVVYDFFKLSGIETDQWSSG